MCYKKLLVFVGVFLLCFADTQVEAQTQAGEEAGGFALDNAILDTALPFAIGAREARQSLRGSFGWPTFQEGLVLGVYFRFDPDGYARFAPTPRLDVDVFEVVCRPRTFSCMGRKNGMSVILNSRGQLQLKIDEIAQGDRFFVSEGVTEIQIPERILQPLDQQLENLLSTGGDLIVRRGNNEVTRISLVGFMPVATYLRWIAARQDYSVMPRGWPVPTDARNFDGAELTSSPTWDSPMPQPQLAAPAAPVTAQTVNPANLAEQRDVDEVRQELNFLRDLLLERSGQAVPVTSPSQQQDSASFPDTEPRLEDLVANVELLQQQLNSIQQPSPPQMQNESSVQETMRKIEYLMDEIGLDMQTAMSVLQFSEPQTETLQLGRADVMVERPPVSGANNIDSRQAPANDVVSQILRELEKEETPVASDQEEPRTNRPSTEEFMLLSKYFRSVVDPYLSGNSN